MLRLRHCADGSIESYLLLLRTVSSVCGHCHDKNRH